MPTSVSCRRRADRVRLRGQFRGRLPAAVAWSAARGRGGAIHPPSGPDAVPGFALLELLVVLVLVGLIAALALPDLERLQGAATRSTQRDHILDQLAGLGRHAMLQERAYVVFGTGGARDAELTGGGSRTAGAGPDRPRARPAGDTSAMPSHAGHEQFVVDLPDGWEIRLDRPLVVYANGVCLGAELALYHRGAEDLRIDLEPPYCGIAPDG